MLDREIGVQKMEFEKLRNINQKLQREQTTNFLL